jgi:hypothetical protein
MMVFCVAGGGLEVEAAVEVDYVDNVLKSGDDALNGGDVLLLEGEGNKCREHSGGGRWGRRADDSVQRGGHWQG